MPEYAEIVPPARLADAVECFWWMRQDEDSPAVHRVMPDACADILFTQGPAGAMVQAVGAMTRFEDYEIRPKHVLMGVRFRPGMWAAHMELPGDRIADRLVPLEDLWGARARRLQERMGNAASPVECAAMMAQALREVVPRTPLQRALGFMEACAGCVSMDNVASEAGLSARQFRRLCLAETGLSPKLLARVLRFRRALLQVRGQAGHYAGLAADCGYTDQSHFIAEFRRFAGRTPAAHAAT